MPATKQNIRSGFIFISFFALAVAILYGISWLYGHRVPFERKPTSQALQAQQMPASFNVAMADDSIPVFAFPVKRSTSWTGTVMKGEGCVHIVKRAMFERVDIKIANPYNECINATRRADRSVLYFCQPNMPEEVLAPNFTQGEVVTIENVDGFWKLRVMSKQELAASKKK